ncbi:peptidase inhibitor family I36 protein [Enhygromyxa salina]|nr:peptidase inhibitor family I36 protein [Enhygromyxa salina]
MFLVSLSGLALLALSTSACDPGAVDDFDEIDERAAFEDEVPDEFALAQGEEPEQSMHDGVVDDPPLEHPGICATVYEHYHYGGDHRDISGGDTSYIGGPWNDKVSSVKVRSGCALNVYEHANYEGKHKTLAGRVRWIGSGWNDRISSYTCSC